jgi:hypothetical protein
MAAAPADRTCSHSGIFTCGAARLGLRVLGPESGYDRLTGGQARIALEDDEAPRHELAMVRHARGDRQQGFDLGGRGSRANELDRLDGTAGLE